MTVIHGDLADVASARLHLLTGVCMGCSGPFCGGGDHTLLFASAFRLWASREACPLVYTYPFRADSCRSITLHFIKCGWFHSTWNPSLPGDQQQSCHWRGSLRCPQGPVPFPRLPAVSGSASSSVQDAAGAMLISREEKAILWHLGITPNQM